MEIAYFFLSFETVNHLLNNMKFFTMKMVMLNTVIHDAFWIIVNHGKISLTIQLTVHQLDFFTFIISELQ